ncbi:MAG: hypothetical protein O2794_04270 [bacterium]|nr:hypothetical protein [bacterium]
MKGESKKYLHVGQAGDLSGWDYVLYRLFEMLPGALAWGTLILMFLLSWKKPIWIAIFIITFDLYWLVKTVFLSFHMKASWRRMQHNLEIDWMARLELLKWNRVWQLVIIPTASGAEDVVTDTIDSIIACKWPKERMILVVAQEERVMGSHVLGEKIAEKYKDIFGELLFTYHPDGVGGELRGKGSNETYALKEVLSKIKAKEIPFEDVIVSSFDEDTRMYDQYFSCLTWNFLTAEKPHRSSFQPVPLYHNNVWEAGSVSRVVASSGTFWQMMQQERPERLTTFSSHSMGLVGLVEANFWQKNIVSEDSRIFWNHYFYFNGDWRTIPLSYPVSLDANLASGFWQTAKNIYKQQRRWGWGVENVPYMLFHFVKNKHVSLRKKLYYTFNALEGFWSWATNALLIFMLGWLPLVLGGREFTKHVISYNLPLITRLIMTLAMIGIVTSAVIAQQMLKKTKGDYRSQRKMPLILQWILMPLTMIIFGAIPGIEAQTRLMLGGRFRLGFWLTPKDRVKS